MRAIHRALTGIVSLTAIFGGASALAAQAPNSGTVLHVSPYVGYMVFGDYIKGPIGTSLTNAPGAIYGTQVGLSLSPNLSLVGNVGYTASDMQIGVPFLGGISVGHSSMLLYDADLEYNLGSAKAGSMPVEPFVQAGAGAIHYNIDESIFTTHATNFAANVGAGADITVSKGVAVRLLARDYIGQFNFKDATGLDLSGQTANNFALSAGLRFDF